MPARERSPIGRGASADKRRDVVFYMPSATPLLRNGHDMPSGGAENQVLILASELASRGHSVAIIAFDDPAGLRASVGGVEVIPQPLPATRLPVVRSLLFYRQAVGRMRAHPARVLVQKAGGINTALAMLGARLGRCRFVYASAGVHDFDYASWEPRRWIVALYHLAVRLADEIVVETAEQARLCRTRFGREPIMIKTIAEPAPARANDPHAFLWIGRLTRHKHPLAYAELARAVPEARFRMIAVQPPGAEGAELSRELEHAAGTLPNLELLAPRPRRDVATLIEQAVAIVSTSWSEGMPNAFMEGWSRSVPSLALRHDPDGVIERERLGAYAHGSPARLADQTRAMWSQRADQEALGTRCREYAARDHDLQQIAAAWERTLKLER